MFIQAMRPSWILLFQCDFFFYAIHFLNFFFNTHFFELAFWTRFNLRTDFYSCWIKTWMLTCYPDTIELCLWCQVSVIVLCASQTLWGVGGRSLWLSGDKKQQQLFPPIMETISSTKSDHTPRSKQDCCHDQQHVWWSMEQLSLFIYRTHILYITDTDGLIIGWKVSTHANREAILDIRRVEEKRFGSFMKRSKIGAG